jgi:hypothetical protein
MRRGVVGVNVRSPLRQRRKLSILRSPAPIGGQVSSASIHDWKHQRADKLDQIETAHAALGGALPGRRWATEQLNHAYAVLLCSQFQGFCRDLHSECVDVVVSAAVTPAMQITVYSEFTRDRRLDRGNPTPDAISADFGRLGLDLWRAVLAADRRNLARRRKLDDLVAWRNAVAHQNFAARALRPDVATLAAIRSWRRSCGALAHSLDSVLGRYLGHVLGASPW